MAKYLRPPSPAARAMRGLLLAVVIVALLIGAVYLLRPYLAPAPAPEPAPPEPAPEPVEPPPPPVPLSELDADAFYYENGRAAYPGALSGIDVSSHQGAIDWSAAAADGVQFAILRVGYRGYTEGEIAEDARFAENLRGAREAGVRLGAYFFSQAVTEAEAEEEARFVLRALDGATLAYPIYFDWEEILTDGARTADLSGAELTACALAFCRTIEEAGYRAGIYFNRDYGYKKYDLAALKDYCFWLAEYANAPTFRYAVGLWQSTDRGTVAGISEPVDLDVYISQP